MVADYRGESSVLESRALFASPKTIIPEGAAGRGFQSNLAIPRGILRGRIDRARCSPDDVTGRGNPERVNKSSSGMLAREKSENTRSPSSPRPNEYAWAKSVIYRSEIHASLVKPKDCWSQKDKEKKVETLQQYIFFKHPMSGKGDRSSLGDLLRLNVSRGDQQTLPIRT
uniref:Uncharacterized protein n=1 Tax=Steinernema glaseri TaxID=37863 RepID=A0A1I7XYZ4_9BILA